LTPGGLDDVTGVEGRRRGVGDGGMRLAKTVETEIGYMETGGKTSMKPKEMSTPPFLLLLLLPHLVLLLL